MANLVSTQYVDTVVVEEAHAAAVEAVEEALAGLAQSDWAESDSTKSSFIKNKPTIPAAQVNSDWNATSGVAQILNKPAIPDTDDYVLIEQDILDDVSGTTYHTSIERAGDAGLRIDSQSYPTDNPDGPSADSFVQVTATMTEIGAAHFSGPAQPGQSNIISQNYLEVDAGGTTLFTNKEHGPYPHLFVATEKGDQPILNELSLRDSAVAAPGFGASVEVDFEHDSIDGVFTPGANAIEVTANNSESGPPVGLRTSYGISSSGAPAMSVQNPDGSWTMFGTYTAAEAPSIAESVKLTAQITARDPDNKGARILLGDNGKAYYKANAANNSVTVADELLTAGQVTASGVSVPIVPTDGTNAGKILLLTPGADPVYSLLPQFIEQPVYRLHSTDEFSALVHLTDDDDNPLLEIALIAGEDFPEYLAVLSSLSSEQLESIQCVYSDRTDDDSGNLEPLTQSAGPDDVQSVVNWHWNRLSDYGTATDLAGSGSIAYEYTAPLVLTTANKYMAAADNDDDGFATKFFHRWTDFIANLVARLGYTTVVNYPYSDPPTDNATYTPQCVVTDTGRVFQWTSSN